MRKIGSAIGSDGKTGLHRAILPSKPPSRHALIRTIPSDGDVMDLAAPSSHAPIRTTIPSDGSSIASFDDIDRHGGL